MRAKTLLTILFLLSLGVAAWLFLHGLPQNATADVKRNPKEEVLVAAGPLAAGTLLRSEDVVWRPAAGVVDPGTRYGRSRPSIPSATSRRATRSRAPRSTSISRAASRSGARLLSSP